MPFLVSHKRYFNPKPVLELHDLTNNLSYNVGMPVLAGKVCIGSQYGWLILIDNALCVISLYNPFSRQEIKLPSHVDVVALLFPHDALPISMSDFISKRFSVDKVVLSHPPTSSTPFPAAAALFDSGQFMYKRFGECDWRVLLSQLFEDITSWRGKFIGITREGYVHELDLDVPKPTFEYIGRGWPDLYKAISYHKHLVSLNNNLLQVWWLNILETDELIIVKIMQRDLQRPFSWIPIDHLFGHSLFLSPTQSFSLSSQSIPGLKDNLIYYIENFRLNKHMIEVVNWKREIGVFDMKNGTYEICTLPNTRLPPSTWASWYIPPFSELWSQSF